MYIHRPRERGISSFPMASLPASAVLMRGRRSSMPKGPMLHQAHRKPYPYRVLLRQSRRVRPAGRTFWNETIVADPHEIVNVCGLKGLDYMMKAADETALDIHFMVPSCVPATPFDHSGATLEAKDMEAPLADDRILGVGEFMNCRASLKDRMPCWIN